MGPVSPEERFYEYLTGIALSARAGIHRAIAAASTKPQSIASRNRIQVSGEYR